MKSVIIALATVSTAMIACKDGQYKTAQMQDATTNEFAVSRTVGYSALNASSLDKPTVVYVEQPTKTKTVVVKQPVTEKTYVSTSSQPAKQKKGWSKAAKGAVIGAGTGAVLGAVISKDNRARNAAIGAVLGAGGGYVIGRDLDKKDGRRQ